LFEFEFRKKISTHAAWGAVVSVSQACNFDSRGALLVDAICWQWHVHHLGDARGEIVIAAELAEQAPRVHAARRLLLRVGDADASCVVT